MSKYSVHFRGTHYAFADLKEVLAKASPARSGDQLAGLAAATAQERVAAMTVLADIPLKRFLEEPVVPYEADEVTRLILDRHDPAAYSPISGFTVGQLREWLLDYATTGRELAAASRRPDAGNGGGGFEAVSESGFDSDRQQMQSGHAVSQHTGAPGPAVGSAPAESPNG